MNYNRTSRRHFHETVCFHAASLTLTLSSISTGTEGNTADLDVSAPSVLLMEASTGAVIYEKNSMKSDIRQASQKL